MKSIDSNHQFSNHMTPSEPYPIYCWWTERLSFTLEKGSTPTFPQNFNFQVQTKVEFLTMNFWMFRAFWGGSPPTILHHFKRWPNGGLVSIISPESFRCYPVSCWVLVCENSVGESEGGTTVVDFTSWPKTSFENERNSLVAPGKYITTHWLNAIVFWWTFALQLNSFYWGWSFYLKKSWIMWIHKYIRYIKSYGIGLMMVDEFISKTGNQWELIDPYYICMVKWNNISPTQISLSTAMNLRAWVRHPDFPEIPSWKQTYPLWKAFWVDDSPKFPWWDMDSFPVG